MPWSSVDWMREVSMIMGQQAPPRLPGEVSHTQVRAAFAATPEPLTNGMREVTRALGEPHLLTLEMWRVDFSRYSMKPVVAMAPGASLDDVERVARQALLQWLVGHHPNTHDGYAVEVSTLHVESVTRVEAVFIDPRVAA